MKQNYGSIGAPADRAFPPPSWWQRLFLSDGQRLVEAAAACRLDVEDLLPLDVEDSVSASLALVDKADVLRNPTTAFHLLQALWRVDSLTLTWCMLGHLFTAFSTIVAPIVIQQVVLAFNRNEGHGADTTAIRTWLLIFFATRIIAVLVDTHTFYAMNHIRLRLLAALRSLLFRKAMRRQLHASSPDTRSLDLSNLATSDAAGCVAAVQLVTTLLVVPLHILVTVYLLYTVLGVAALPGIVVIILSLFTNFQIAHVMGTAYAKLMVLRDQRMRTVNEAFSAMHHVKLNMWGHWFQTKLFRQRDGELEELKNFVYAAAASSFVLWGSPLLVSTISFATFALILGHELTAAKVFTATVLFNVLRGPLQDLPGMVQSLFQSHVSIQRILHYLQMPELDPTNIHYVSLSGSFAVQLKDASFTWHAHSSFGLENLSLEIYPGDLVVISGDVGAGKTAFCLALLGELPQRSGSAMLAGSIAYVSQIPWIQHQTIRDNILFGRAMDWTKYNQVLHACCLQDDLKLFPAGDLTEIGERGVNLSGGQKMRLALARACYADADIYILDAPLAPLDGTVQQQLLERCFGHVLARKTVILTSHQPELLTMVNLHIHLKNGKASVTTRRGVCRSPRPFQDTIDPIEAIVATQTPETTRTLLVEEERASGDVSGHVWSQYFIAIGGVGLFLLLVVTQLLWQVFQISSDVWLSTSTTQHRSSFQIIQVYAVLAMGTAIMVLVRSLVISQLGLKASATLFRSLVTGLLHAPVRFFDQTPIGRVLNRFVDDILVIDRSIPTALGLFLNAAFATVCALCTAGVGIGGPGVLLIPIAIIYLIVAWQCIRAFCELMRLRKLCLAPILSELAQGQRGVVTLRAFGDVHVNNAIDRLDACVDQNSRLFHSEILLNQWFIQRLQFLGCGVLVIVLGTVFCFHDRFSAGTVGLVLTYTVSVNSALTSLVRVWARSENMMVSVERVLTYSHLVPEGSMPHDVVPIAAAWPSQGQIVFENVCFGYAPGKDLVLHNVSFIVHAGETIGVIGRTGAGKSSLVMALCRLYDQQSGCIRIDGVDLTIIPLDRVRHAIAIIPQSPILLEGTVRTFLDPYNEVDDAKLVQALDQVQFVPILRRLQSSSSDISILNVGLHAEGDNLSVGQRQLLCLARVLVRKTKIVVLDEATAAVDETTERCVASTLARELGDTTRVVIAHRLATVASADRLLMLHNGRVVAYDIPQNVLATHQDVDTLVQDM